MFFVSPQAMDDLTQYCVWTSIKKRVMFLHVFHRGHRGGSSFVASQALSLIYTILKDERNSAVITTRIVKGVREQSSRSALTVHAQFRVTIPLLLIGSSTIIAL